jgi:hypothetical protein
LVAYIDSLSVAIRKECIMCCALCASDNEAEFTTEMNMHFSGLRNIDKPGVLVFPRVLVCLDCGFSRFTTPETELRVLAKGIAVSARLLNSPLAVEGFASYPTIHR